MARALPSRFLSSRRRVLKTAGAATLALASPSALADADGVAPSGSIPGRFTPRLKLQL
jgi:hypothetical protein